MNRNLNIQAYKSAVFMRRSSLPCTTTYPSYQTLPLTPKIGWGIFPKVKMIQSMASNLTLN